MSLKRRAAIIGTGNVGSTTAFSLAVQGIVNELVLVDSDERKAEGHALDLEGGAEEVVELRLPPEELAALTASAAVIKSYIEQL
ncbi:MAG: hypothetical protein LBG26_06425 [Treponema sp.]|nr:hypothetical protein [Treponema sp.]